MPQDRCDHEGCGVAATVDVVDDAGNLDHRACRGHAVQAARGHARRFSYVDSSTKRPILVTRVEVLIEDGI